VNSRFSAADLCKAVERELGFRRRVFARRVQSGAMAQWEADREIAMFEVIHARYKAEADAEDEAGRLL
jgi:hypothetical protein